MGSIAGACHLRLVPLQRAAAQAIVNIFETGSIRGSYGEVALIQGDAGQLSYGRSQATLASGNLYLLVRNYVERRNAAFGTELEPYLPRLQACDPGLNHDLAFRSLLQAAGDDPVMHDAQDQFFERVFWEPAVKSAEALGVTTALGLAIVYDSMIHGSWARLRDVTRGAYGELALIGETAWLGHYVKVRREWFESHPNPLLRRCTYRMQAFEELIRAGNWKLGLPIALRGVTLSEQSLAAAEPVKVSAEGLPHRLLRSSEPPMRGPDVCWVQRRLTRSGYRVIDSGVYDAQTAAAVRAFQQAHDLVVDGLVGPATRTALEDVALRGPLAADKAEEPMPALPVRPPPPAVAPGPPPVTAAPSPPAPAPSRPPPPQGRGARARPPAAKPQPGGWRRLISGWPYLWAGLSALLMTLAQIRDAIITVQAGTWSRAFPVPVRSPVAAPPDPEPLELLGFAYARAQEMAAGIPANWVLGLRIGALVVLVYAIVRLMMQKARIARLMKELARVHGDADAVS